MAASDSEDDLFEEAREDLRSLASSQKDLKMPESKELFDQKETTNKILAKERVVVEEEVEENAENDEEKLQKILLSQLRSMDRSESENSGETVNIKVINKSSVEDDKINCLEDDDISKYIGAEEDDNKDKLFG